MSRRNFPQRITSPPPSRSRSDYLSGHQGSFCSLLEEFSPKPWVTLVLGPGWLSQREREEALLAILRRLAGALGSMGTNLWAEDLPDGAQILATTQRFAADMAADRLLIDPPRELADMAPAGRGVRDDGGDAWIVKILISSMLATNLYFTLRALDPGSAFHRVGHGAEAVEPTGTNALWVHCQLTVRLRSALKALAEELAGDVSGARALAARVLEGRDASDLDEVTNRFLDSFGVVVNAIRGTLEPQGGSAPRLARADVRALTELAWFSLSTFADDTYPGWLDLLLELSHYDAPEHSSVGQPSFDNVKDAGDAIRARYLRLTSNSWRRTRDPERYPSTKVHDAVAALLVGQAAARDALPAGSRLAPPPAVAHVTSFDLELEMALLRAGQPFHVVFPVHVVDTFNKLLYPRWCVLDVQGPDLNDVLRPRHETVRMLSGAPRELSKVAGPMVVRLTGSPLIELPPLTIDGRLTPVGVQILGSEPDDRGRRESGDEEILRAFSEALRKSGRQMERAEVQARKLRQMTMRHAVIVSEHDAMLHNAMDSHPWSEGISLCRRLPLDTVVDQGGRRRFWMLLGVQVGDNAIRQRVTHVVAWYPGSDTRRGPDVVGTRREAPVSGTGPATDGNGSEEEMVAAGADGLGVFVSRHVGHVEQDLLYWNRFDIVENADAHLFADDLRHVAEQHLHPEDSGAMIRCPDA